MTTYIVLGIVAVVLLLTNTNLGSVLKEYLNKKKVEEKTELDIEVKNPDLPVPPAIPPIYEIVEQWHVLKELCERAHLGESVKSLDAVFLNLLKKENVNAKNNN